jgi:RHS repeat-associated protein
VRKVVGGVATRFEYGASGELIAEWKEANGSLIKEYFYEGGESLAATKEGGGYEYATGDHLGSPRAWTDDAGNLVAGGRHDYCPFGEELFVGVGVRTSDRGYANNTQQDGQRKQFTSKERDSETGLDYFGARYFSSIQGRFASADPTLLTGRRLLDPQQLNLYVYVRDNPLKYVDPTGEDLRIVVTNIVTSGNSKMKTHVNHRPGGGLPQEKVNTYKLIITNDSGSKRVFNVSRDTNYNGTTSQTRGDYGSGSEAPPGAYRGHTRSDGSRGFRVELYDPEVDKGNKDTIQSPDGTLRHNVQIHIGPGCSEGCMLLTGGATERDNFKDAVNDMLKEDKDNNKGQDIYVTVQDRNSPNGRDEPDLPVTNNASVFIITTPPKEPKKPKQQ